MMSSRMRLRSLLWAALFVPLACDSPSSEPTSQLTFPDELRLFELPETERTRVRASLEISGVLPETPLTLSSDLRSARGRFTLEDADVGTHPFVLQVRYDDEVLLAEATGEVTINAQTANPLVPKGGFTTCEPTTEGDTDCSLRFDLNRNGLSNLADLLGDCPAGADDCTAGPRDPRPLSALLDVAPSLLQFPSGIPLGSFGRQVILVENLADHEVTVDAKVVGAPGMSLSRFELSPDPDEAGLPRLERLTLAPYEQLFLAVSYAPTNRYFTAGEILLDVDDPPSLTRQSVTVSVVGNADGELRTPPEGYAPAALLPSADLGGFDGEVRVFARESLFAGLPTPQVQALTSTGTRMRAPLRNASGETVVRQLNADAVLLVEIPGLHRLNLRLGGLTDDIDLTLLLLDDADAISADPGEHLGAWRGGTFPEAVQYRNTSMTTRRGLVVLSRRGVADSAAAPNALTEALSVPVELTGLLTDAPEFTERPSPRRGPIEGGTRITLTGRGFAPGALVSLGGRAASDCSYTVTETGLTQLTCTTPPGSLAEGSNPATLVVQNPSPASGGDGQAATLVEGFLYEPPAPTLSSLRPAVAPLSGSDGTIMIRGEHFLARNGPPRVLFGEVEADSVLFVDPSWLEVVAPPQGAAGEVKLRVQNRLDPIEGTGSAARLSAPSNALLFAYTTPTLPAPSLNAARPLDGAPTCVIDATCAIELEGTGFVDGMLVNVGSFAATNVVVSEGGLSATATVPAVSTGAARTVEVILPDGQRARREQALTWGYAPLTLGTVVPSLTPTLGGASVDVYGAGFRDGARATFLSSTSGETAAVQTTRVSSTLLRVLTPALPAGLYGLRVVDNDGGETEREGAITMVEPAGEAPQIDVIAPATAALGLGDVTVTLQGRHFRNPSVYVGTEALTLLPLSAAEDGTTHCKVLLPTTSLPGTIALRLINDDGTSDSVAFTWLSPETTKVSLVLPEQLHSRVKGEKLRLVGTGLLEADEAVVVRSTGTTEEVLFAANLEEQSDTGLVLELPEVLTDLAAAGGSYRIDLRRGGALLARSPSFFARDPRVVATVRSELGITLFGEFLHPSAFVEAKILSTGPLVDDAVRQFTFLDGTDAVVQLEAVSPVPLVPGATYQLAIYHDIDPADGVIEKTTPVLVDLDPTGVATGALAVAPLALEVPTEVLPASSPLPVISAFLPAQAGLPPGAAGIDTFGAPAGFELRDGQGAVKATGTWSSSYDAVRSGHEVSLVLAANTLLDAGDYAVRLKTSASAQLADSSSLLPVRSRALSSVTPTEAISSMRATLVGSFFQGDLIVAQGVGGQRELLELEGSVCSLAPVAQGCTASVALDALTEGTWQLCHVPAHVAPSTATCPSSPVTITIRADACDAANVVDGYTGGFLAIPLEDFVQDPCSGSLVRGAVVSLDFKGTGLDPANVGNFLTDIHVQGTLLPNGPAPSNYTDEVENAEPLSWYLMPSVCDAVGIAQCTEPTGRFSRGDYQLLVVSPLPDENPPEARFSVTAVAPNGSCLSGEDLDSDLLSVCQGDCQNGSFSTLPGAPWKIPAGFNLGADALTIAAFETCDGIDNNCDLLVDNLPSRCLLDPAAFPSAVGACRVGREVCLTDQGAGPPTTCIEDLLQSEKGELCDDLVDNDCDGTVDELPCEYVTGRIPYLPRTLDNPTTVSDWSGWDTNESASVDKPIDIGFSFPFFGKTYTELYITPYGLVGFEPQGADGWPLNSDLYPCYSNEPVRRLTQCQDVPGSMIVAAYGSFGSIDAPPSATTSTNGAAGQREFVIEFVMTYEPDAVTTQIILQEATGLIEIHTVLFDNQSGTQYPQLVLSPNRRVVDALPGRATSILPSVGSLVHDAVRFAMASKLSAGSCGDGVCDPAEMGVCGADCLSVPIARCGNGLCEPEEWSGPGQCRSDCGFDRCGDSVCQDGSQAQPDLAERDPDAPADPISLTCLLDCHCGDGVCQDGVQAQPDLGENPSTCCNDCGGLCG